MDETKILSLSALSDEELWQQVQHWTPHQWMREISKLTSAQISVIVPAATSKHDALHWKEKLAAVISGLTERAQLEAAGKTLSLPQSIEILSFAAKQPSCLDKLPRYLLACRTTFFVNF